jgi:hypothetical protein
LEHAGEQVPPTIPENDTETVALTVEHVMAQLVVGTGPQQVQLGSRNPRAMNSGEPISSATTEREAKRINRMSVERVI